MIASNSLLTAPCLRSLPSPNRPPDLARSVQRQFQQSGYLALRQIACEYTEGVVTLSGRLPSHHLKQIAQAIAMKAVGGRDVVNQIDVILTSNASRQWGSLCSLTYGPIASIDRRDRTQDFGPINKGVEAMLVLSRKMDETVVIDGGIRVTILGIQGKQVRLGIEAPGEVGVYREELLTAGRTDILEKRNAAKKVRDRLMRNGVAASSAASDRLRGGQSLQIDESNGWQHESNNHAGSGSHGATETVGTGFSVGVPQVVAGN